MPDQNARAKFQEFVDGLRYSPGYLPIHPHDRRLRALALRALYLLQRANNWGLTEREFRRAWRANKRAARRYQHTLMRREVYRYWRVSH